MSWLYRLTGRLPAVVIARRNVSRARIRSALAAATVVIGVVAIGAIGAGGAAFQESQLDTIRDQGANNVFVLPGVDRAERSFDREDVRAIEAAVGTAGVVATDSGTMELVTRGDRRERLGVTYIEDPRALYTVRFGEIPENWRRSAVVSGEFARERGLAVGDRITLAPVDRAGAPATGDERTYRVVAVLEPTRAFGASPVYLPIEEAPDRRYSQIRITTRSVDRAEAVATTLRERFNQRKDRLLVLELTSLVRLFKTIVNGINLFLTGLGAISLLVAGVSIANTMLMAVIKRREEIGVLRAVGYSKADIVRILLIESALLGVIGAAVGVVLAVGAALVANAVFLGDPLAFTPTAVTYLLLAVGFGVLTSLLAGVYPAWRAANERPVEALRG